MTQKNNEIILIKKHQLCFMTQKEFKHFFRLERETASFDEIRRIKGYKYPAFLGDTL